MDKGQKAALQLAMISGIVESMNQSERKSKPNPPCKHMMLNKCGKKLGTCNGYKRCKKREV